MVLREHTVGGEHAEDALEILGVAVITDTCEDLGGGERRVGSTLPDGISDVEADYGIEGHGDADHVG